MKRHYFKSVILYLKGVICLSLLMILSIQSGIAQNVAPEDVIPAYTASCILIHDTPKIANAMKASSVWQELMKTFQQEMEKNSGDDSSSMKFFGANIIDLLAIATDQVAIIQIDPTKMDSPSIIVDLGDAKSALEMIQKVMEMFGDKEKGNIVPNAGTYLNIPYGIIKPDARFAFLNNLFVYAPEQNMLEDVINVYLDKEPSIIEDPKFNMATSKITTDGEILIYANSEVSNPITQAIMRNEPMKLLGTGGVKATAMKINLLAPTKDMEFYMYSGDSSSIMTGMLSESGALLSPHIIPITSANIFYAFNIGSFASLWEKTMESIKKEMSEDEYNNIQSALSQFEMQKGLNIQNDILGSLTGEIGIAFAIPEPDINANGTGAVVQKGIMIFFGVSNKQKIQMCLERIFSDKPMDKTQYKGVEIRYMPSMSGDNAPFGYIFADELMVFSNIKSLMKIIDEENPLVSSESFANINKKLSQSSNALFYIDLKKIMASLPINQSPESLVSLQEIGAIGGSMAYDGQGIRTYITGDQAKNWLDIIGGVINNSIKSKMKE